MESNRNYLLEEKPLSLLVKLGIPAVVMALVDELNSFIDAVFMGQYFGSEAVSSMSIILPIMLLIVSIGTFISEGMSIAVSRFLGAKNFREANRYTINALVLTLVVSGVCGGLFYLSLPSIMAQFNLSETVKLYSLLYLRILCLGMPVFMLTLLLGRIVYIEGKTALLLSTTILQLGSNVLINYVLIGLLNFGVEGAAIGTLIAECIQIVILYKYIQSIKRNDHKTRN